MCVIGIIIAENKLTGELPAELGDLKKLSFLDVRKLFLSAYSDVLKYDILTIRYCTLHGYDSMIQHKCSFVQMTIFFQERFHVK